MCGIFAFSSITEITKAMAPILACEMESRGDDSWGCTNGELYHKDPVSILEGWSKFHAWKEWQSVVFHTRGASVGKVSKENSHPFFGWKNSKELIIGVHNGHVSNWKEMNEKYDRKCEVDSEHIFLHLAAGLDLKELASSGAIVWYDNGQMKFAKTSLGSLEVVRLITGEMVICSTMSAIRKAAIMAGSGIGTFLKEIKPGHEHSFVMQDGKLKIHEGEDIHFVYGGYEVKKHKNHEYQNPYTQRSKLRPNCSICYKQVEADADIACQTCLDDAEVSVQAWEAANRLKEMPKYLGMTVQ